MRSALKICITTILFCSCSNATDKNGDDDARRALISWNSEFVAGDGQQMTGYYKDREEFIKPYTSRKYSGDTLRVETLHEINSCAETIGDIKFSNDTLFLLTKIVTDEVCGAVKFHKFKYTIVKKGIKNYTIKF